MRLTDKNKIKELATLQKNNVLMTDADYKELKLGQLEDILEKYNIDTNDELEVLCKYVEDVKHWMSIHKEKMLEIKRIEEELGIDLTILFKAYTNGFYVKGEAEKQYIDFENCLNATAFKNKEMFYGHKRTYQYVKLFDYGTTWSLTKKELENETNE